MRSGRPAGKHLNDHGVVMLVVLMALAVTSLMVLSMASEAVQTQQAISKQATLFNERQRTVSNLSMIMSELLGEHRLTAKNELMTGYKSAINYITSGFNTTTGGNYWSRMISADTSGYAATFTSLNVQVNQSGTTKDLGPGFLVGCDKNAQNAGIRGTYRMRHSIDVRKPVDPTITPIDPNAGTIIRVLANMGLTVEVCKQDACSGVPVTPATCEVGVTLAFLSPMDYPIFIDETLNWGPAGSVSLAWGDMEIRRGLAYFGSGAFDPNNLIDIGEVFHTPKEKDRSCNGANTSNCVLDDPSVDKHGGDWPKVLSGSVEHDINSHALKVPFPTACRYKTDSKGMLGKECYKPMTDLMNCIDNCKNPPACGNKFDSGGTDGMLSCKWDDNGDGTIQASEPYQDDTLVSTIAAGEAWTVGLATFNGNVNDGNIASVPNVSLGCGISGWSNLLNPYPIPIPICDGRGIVTGSNTLQNVRIKGNLDISGAVSSCQCVLGTTNCGGSCNCNPCFNVCSDCYSIPSPTCFLSCGWCVGIPCIPGCQKNGNCGFNVGGTVVVEGNAKFRNHFQLNPGAKLYVMGNLEIEDANLSDSLRNCVILPCLEGQLMALDIGSYKYRVWTKENSTLYVRGDTFIKGADVGVLTEASLLTYTFFCSLFNPILGLFGISCPVPAPYIMLGPRPSFGGETNNAGTILDDSKLLVRGLTPTIRDTNANGQLADENPQGPEGSSFSGVSNWHQINHYKWRTKDLYDLAIKSGGMTRTDMHPGRNSNINTAYTNPAQRGDLCCHAPCDKGGGTNAPWNFTLDPVQSLKDAINMVPVGNHVHRHAFDKDNDNNCDDKNQCAALTYPAAPTTCQSNFQDHEAEQYFAQSNTAQFNYWNGAGWSLSAPWNGACTTTTNPLNSNYWGFVQPAYKGHADLEIWSYGSPCITAQPYLNLVVNGTVFSAGGIATNQTTVGMGNLVSIGPQAYPEHLTSALVNTNSVCDNGYGFPKDKNHSFNVIAGGDLFTAQGLGLESFVCSGVDFNGLCTFLLTLGCLNTGLFSGNSNYGVVYSNGKAGYEESSLFNANSINSNGNLMARHMVSPEDVFDSLEGFCNFFGFTCTVYNQPCVKINRQPCDADGDGSVDDACRYDDKLQQLGFPISQLIQLVSVQLNGAL